MVRKNVALLLAWLCFAIPAICFASGYSSPGISTPVSIANGGTGSATAAAHTVFGNTTGSTAAPAYTATPSFTSFAATGASTIVNSTNVTGLDIYKTVAGSARIFGVRGADGVYALEVTDSTTLGRNVSVQGNLSTNLIDVFAGSSIVMHAGQLLLEDAGATHVNSYFDAGGNLIFQPATDIVPVSITGGGVKSAHLMDLTGNGANGFFDQYGGYTGRSFTDLGGGQLFNNTITYGTANIANDVTSSSGNFIASAVAKGVHIKSGANGLTGSGTLVNGVATIATTAIDANDVVIITRTGGTLSTAGVIWENKANRVNATSFEANSYYPLAAGATAASATDNATFDWIVQKVD